MNQKIKNIILIVFLSTWLTGLNAQNAVIPAGGIGSGSGGSISYSVGQVAYTTASAINGSIAQGVQQPFEISVVTSIENNAIELSMVVYPNPSTDYLKLKIETSDIENYQYQLYDIKGNLIVNKMIIAEETEINMQNLLSGIYIMKVSQGIKELKTFKIIKK